MITNQTYIAALEKLEAILQNEENFPISFQEKSAYGGPANGREKITGFTTEEYSALRLFLKTVPKSLEIELPKTIVLSRKPGKTADLKKAIGEEIELRNELKALASLMREIGGDSFEGTSHLSNILNTTPNVTLASKQEDSLLSTLLKSFKPLIKKLEDIGKILEREENPSPSVSEAGITPLGEEQGQKPRT
jgi:hypothetical protein